MSAIELAVLQSVSAALNRDGFAKIKGVFDPKVVDMIRETANRLWKDPATDKHKQWIGKKPALLFWPNTFSGFMKGISRSNVMKEIVRHVLGDDVLQLNNQIYYRTAGDGDQFAWHQDICFRTPESAFDQIETGYLQTVIVVDKITRDNGAIEFIPGSHKLGNLNLIPRDNSETGLRKFHRGVWRGVKVEAEPGDVILWSVMTVHGSEENRTNTNRQVFMNGFAKSSAVKVKSMFQDYLVKGE